MNCAQAVEMAALYLSGELGGAQAAEVRAHLAACPACEREFAQQRNFDLRVWREVLNSDVDTTELEGRIRAQIGPRPARRWMGVAAGVALAIGLAGLIYRFAPDSRTVYAAAAQDHRGEVTLHQHRNWSVDAAGMQALARREGLDPEAIFRLSPAGYRLQRAKFCRLAGRAFLHLVYSDGAQEFSVFLASHDATNPGAIRSIELGAERVAAFRTSHLDAMIVTDQPGDRASELAGSARAALPL